SSEIANCVMEVAELLSEQGAELVEVELPGAERTHEMASVLIYSEVALYNRKLLQNPPQMTPRMFERMRRGLDYTALDYAHAMQFKAEWKAALGTVFEEVDLLLTPTSPVEALPNNDTADLHT